MNFVLGAALMVAVAVSLPASAQTRFEAGDPQLQALWAVPAKPPAPVDNTWSAERFELGKKLFFDPRLSGSGQVTCASCHMPERGWSDGLPTAMRFLGQNVHLATLSLTNIAYHSIYMWDGRQPTLEQQAFAGLGENTDINAGSRVRPEEIVRRLAAIAGYRTEFEKAYPGEGVTRATMAKALASFERGLVSRDSPFDRWVAGDKTAMTPQQVNGFRVFVDPGKGACTACHHPPHFTDNGFHNLGLKSYGDPDPHPGRARQRPVKAMHGAFKTPGLRDVALTAPYFHDGSALTLRDVVEHYARGGDVRTNLSPSFKKAEITEQEKDDLVAFLQALTSPPAPFTFPQLPR